HLVSTLAGHLTSTHVKALQENLAAQEKTVAAEDIRAMVQLDMEYHLMYAGFHRNQYILSVMTSLADKMKLVILQVLEGNPSRMDSSYAEHLASGNAVIEGNAPLAWLLIREHLRFGNVFLTSRAPST